MKIKHSLIRKEYTMISNRLSRPLNIIVGFLAIVGMSASAAHYFLPTTNPGFLIFPLIVALHVIMGGIYLAIGPFQFVPRIRSRWLNYHRWTGRLLVAAGLIVGTTGLFMAWIIPFAGWSERVIMGCFGLLFLVALSKGFLHIRAGRIMQHREWMIRAFAIGLGIATQRLILIPTLIALGPSEQNAVVLSQLANLLAFPAHILFAEFWIRTTRGKRTAIAAKKKTLASNTEPLL
jgi:uncharacterized membrane protein